ncbi:hypothetical protein HU200_058525 [Digitaria exilis]|uniref:Uncharacterized protein n=1 Tax=Digitaria exilis TaxID=1010633 RepID=A0A835E0F2_9POAL|nr:hypothetical protein HU200_058525 [Digitaria exilis]
MRLTGPHPAKFPGRLPPSHSRGVRHPATGGGIYESSVAPPSLGRGGMLPRHHRRPAHSEPAFSDQVRFQELCFCWRCWMVNSVYNCQQSNSLLCIFLMKPNVNFPCKVTEHQVL